MNLLRLSQGTQVVNSFVRLYETLGSGEFCKVKRAVLTLDNEDGDQVQEEYAVKIYNKQVLKKKIYYTGESHDGEEGG